MNNISRITAGNEILVFEGKLIWCFMTFTFDVLMQILRGVQGPRDLQNPPERSEKCARRVPPKPQTLGEAEISCGMVGLD